jgi:O-antigen/teichoic acid export membrane protein
LIVGIGIAGMLFWRRFGQMMLQYPMIWDRWLIREWIWYAWWVFLWANVSILFSQIDLQFALYFLGKEAAGYWTTYSSLLTAIGLITGPLAWYLFPLVNELTVKWEQHKLQLLMRYVGFWLLWCVLVVWLFVYRFGPWVAVLLFGEQFRYSGELFRFAAPFVMIWPAVSFAFQYLAWVGKVKERVIILSIGLVATIVLNLTLIPLFWLKGIVLSMAMSYFVMWLGVIWIIKKKH